MKEQKNETVKKPSYAVTLCKGTFVAYAATWLCVRCGKKRFTSNLGNPWCCGTLMIRIE